MVDLARPTNAMLARARQWSNAFTCCRAATFAGFCAAHGRFFAVSTEARKLLILDVRQAIRRRGIYGYAKKSERTAKNPVRRRRSRIYFADCCAARLRTRTREFGIDGAGFQRSGKT